MLIRTFGKKSALKTKREEIIHVFQALLNTQVSGLHTENVARGRTEAFQNVGGTKAKFMWFRSMVDVYQLSKSLEG